MKHFIKISFHIIKIFMDAAASSLPYSVIAWNLNEELHAIKLNVYSTFYKTFKQIDFEISTLDSCI